MNKVALGTVLGAALLGLTKSKSGGRSVESKFIYNRSYFKGLESEWISGGPKQEAMPELIVFSTLIPSDPDINVYGTGEFNKEIKKKPNAESVFVQEVRNKGEPDFRKAKNLKHLAIRGTFKELRPERFAGLNKLESLAIFSENMKVIPKFLKDIPNLKMLYIAAPVSNLKPLEGMTQLTFLKVSSLDPLLSYEENPRVYTYGHDVLKTLTSLEYLYLGYGYRFFDNSSQFECFTYLKNLKQLFIHQESRISMTKYSDENHSGGYKYLSSCKKLEFLCLFNTEFHPHEGISLGEELGKMPNLKYLLLPYDGGGWMGHDYMTLSDKKLPKLEYLWISNLENLTFDGRFKSLETLCLKAYSDTNRYYSQGLQTRKTHGLENLSNLKNVYIDASTYQNYVVDMMAQLFSIRSIENIHINSRHYYNNLDLYNTKISCTKIKTLTLLLNRTDIALPKDIKKCKELEKIYITNRDSRVAFNKSLFTLPKLKDFHANQFFLYNPRVDSIAQCTKMPVELMYDSNISFYGEEVRVDVSELSPEFLYKIFSENKLTFAAKGQQARVSFYGMEISVERSLMLFYLSKTQGLPFNFTFTEDDDYLITQLPISIDYESIKEISERETKQWGETGKIRLGIKFKYPTSIATKISQPKYLDQPLTSLQQWKTWGLTQQQYYKIGQDKKYKENPLYVPYRTLVFNHIPELYDGENHFFNPDVYVKPFAQDIEFLNIGKSIPFKELGSISFPSLKHLSLNFHENESPRDIYNLTEEIFNAAPNLETIRIEGINVKSIPDNIGSLKSLARLTITNTSITDLPSTMKMNKKLFELNLHANKIRSYPIVFADLQFTVTRFKITGNPLDQNQNLGQLFFTMKNKVQRALQNPNLTAVVRDHYENLRYTHRNPILERIVRTIKYPNYSETNKIRKR